MSTAGRNDPCPCGSGLKYKKCCLQKTFVQTGKEESIKQRLVQELLGYFRKYHKASLDDAYAFYWDDFDPEEYLSRGTLGLAEINFWEWVVFDFEVDEDSGKTLIDAYIENNKRLTLDELNVLNMMRHAVISLYEVQGVFPEKGLLVKDLLLGGEYDVREKAATKSLRKWDIFAARLLHLDGQYTMSGAVYPYAVRRKEEIISEIKEDFEGFKSEYPDGTLDDYLKKNSDYFVFLWYEPIQNPPPFPKLATTTGEAFLFSKAHFNFKDRSSVIESLKTIREFEKEKGDEFVWLAERDKDGSATMLGRIEVKDKNLLLECNSKERLERGKKLLLDHVSGLTHKIDTFEDPEQAMKSSKNRPSFTPANEIPMEIQQQVYTKTMQKHCENWLNESIPALNGQTPTDAVKTNEGKVKVIELLKSFENMEEHNKRDGRPYYDLGWMWEKLRLERE
jgi:hypothetical protein